MFGWAAVTKMGPNNARRVVWAFDTYYFFSSCLYIYINFYSQKRYNYGHPGPMTTVTAAIVQLRRGAGVLTSSY